MIGRALAFGTCLFILATLLDSSRLASAQDQAVRADSLGRPDDRWHLKAPFWESSVVHGESLFFVQEAAGQLPWSNLLLSPSRITKVSLANGLQTFEEGQDFQVNLALGRLELPAGSRIPFVEAEELFPPLDSARGIDHLAGNSDRKVLFDNQRWFHDQQVEVTYSSSEQWQGYRPEFADVSLRRTIDKLRKGEPLTIAVTGDSITYGLNASKLGGGEPQMPAYPDLVASGLESSYRSEVKLVNNAVSGWRLEQGLEHLDGLLASKPDLMIIAFGMNHFGSRDADGFKKSLEAMLDRIRGADKNIEVILVAPMHGNRDWVHTPADQFGLHRDVLASFVGPNIALADLTTLWGQMLERKRFVDLTGNGVNHPNDFGHCIYASVILGLLSQPFDTEKSDALPMAPDEVVRTAGLPEGFELSVFAAEPDVQNPIAICTDERGRLWVAENNTWAGASLGQFRDDLNDRIVILEDSDGDGKHDRRTVFWDKAKKLTSVEVGHGGVWALTPPHLVFIPDANRDDVPDGPPIPMLDGFDSHDVSHNVANGLRWGPDGWLYGRHGILATSRIGVPGAAESQRVRINTGVWRYHPASRVVEDVLHGMTNSWGFDYDRHGEMFCINTVIGHLWHVLPGARTQRMFGIDRNPHAYQLIEQVADHVHWDTGEAWSDVRKGISDTTLAAGGGHAHIGLMIYQGDSWPEKFRNKVYTLNMHGRRINCDRIESEGAHFVARHEPDFVTFADPFFRGMDMVMTADGGVLIADWSDTGECHDHDGVHRSSGRIYKLSYGKPKPVVGVDLGNADNETLLEALSAPNVWWARQAVRVLHDRASLHAPDASSVNAPDSEGRGSSTGLRESLLKMATGEGDAVSRLRAVWALNAVGGLDAEVLLNAPDEQVRVWGIRLLCDRLMIDAAADPRGIATQFRALAARESSGLVALYLASALQKLPLDLRWEIAEALAARADLSGDRPFSIMLWLGIEPAVPVMKERSIEIAKLSHIPLLTQNIARRLTVEIESDPRSVDRLVTLAGSDELRFPDEVVTGMALALKGWRSVPPPENWTALAAKFSKSDSELVRRYTQELSVVFGDGRAIGELRALVVDSAADPDARRQALRAILASRPSDLLPILHSLLGDRAVVVEAVRGLSLYDDPTTPSRMLNASGAFSPEARTEMINTLASRPAYAKVLLQAIRQGSLRANEVSAFHARQIEAFGDESLRNDLISVWGDVRATGAEKLSQIQQLKRELEGVQVSAAGLSNGRAVFNQVCASCHVLYGQGKNLGPDLTGSNRKQLDYLLENIIDPSASVGADFRAMLFSVDDGRILSGVVREQSDRTVTIQTAQEVITLERDQIIENKPTATSLMPDGLLQNLSPEQIRDLIAYLGSSEQAPLP